MGLAHSPRIVTDSLVLCLDAANTKSYGGSGTTWTDLSGNGNDFTLVNGVGYDSGNNGSLSFDGSNDYATRAHDSNNELASTALNFSTALTISVWFYSGNAITSWLYLKGRTDADHYNPLFYVSGRYGWVGGDGRSFYDSPSGYIKPFQLFSNLNNCILN